MEEVLGSLSSSAEGGGSGEVPKSTKAPPAIPWSQLIDTSSGEHNPISPSCLSNGRLLASWTDCGITSTANSGHSLTVREWQRSASQNRATPANADIPAHMPCFSPPGQLCDRFHQSKCTRHAYDCIQPGFKFVFSAQLSVCMIPRRSVSRLRKEPGSPCLASMIPPGGPNDRLLPLLCQVCPGGEHTLLVGGSLVAAQIVHAGNVCSWEFLCRSLDCSAECRKVLGFQRCDHGFSQNKCADLYNLTRTCCRCS